MASTPAALNFSKTFIVAGHLAIYAVVSFFAPAALAQSPKRLDVVPPIGPSDSQLIYRQICSESPYRLIARNALPAEAVGNSMAAIENAVSQGYYHIGLDISSSSDGIPFAYSSNSLKLEDGTESKTCEFGFSEVSTVQPFFEYAERHFGLNSKTISCLEDVKSLNGELFDDQKIASLGAIFKKFGKSINYFLNIIPSTCNMDIGKKLAYLIERNGLENHVWVETNNMGLIENLSTLNPKIKIVHRTTSKQLSDKKILKKLRQLGVGGFSFLYDKRLAKSLEPLKLEEPIFVVGVGTSRQVVDDLCSDVDYIVSGSNFLADLSRFAYESFNEGRKKIKFAKIGSKLSRDLEAKGLAPVPCGKKTAIHLEKSIFDSISADLKKACGSES
jgi:glycerophosphoryl diester phosphodiesterase